MVCAEGNFDWPSIYPVTLNSKKGERKVQEKQSIFQNSLN